MPPEIPSCFAGDTYPIEGGVSSPKIAPLVTLTNQVDVLGTGPSIPIPLSGVCIGFI